MDDTTDVPEQRAYLQHRAPWRGLDNRLATIAAAAQPVQAEPTAHHPGPPTSRPLTAQPRAPGGPLLHTPPQRPPRLCCACLLHSRRPGLPPRRLSCASRFLICRHAVRSQLGPRRPAPPATPQPRSQPAPGCRRPLTAGPAAPPPAPATAPPPLPAAPRSAWDLAMAAWRAGLLN